MVAQIVVAVAAVVAIEENTNFAKHQPFNPRCYVIINLLHNNFLSDLDRKSAANNSRIQEKLEFLELLIILSPFNSIQSL